MIVHVGIFVVQVPRSHCDARNGTFAHGRKEDFKIADETDKLLWISVACVVMLTSGVSCVHLSLVSIIL